MSVQVTSTNYVYDDDYNITEVTVQYNVTETTDKLTERGSGRLKITGEEFQGNETPQKLVVLIEQERNKDS